MFPFPNHPPPMTMMKPMEGPPAAMHSPVEIGGITYDVFLLQRRAVQPVHIPQPFPIVRFPQPSPTFALVSAPYAPTMPPLSNAVFPSRPFVPIMAVPPTIVPTAHKPSHRLLKIMAPPPAPPEKSVPLKELSSPIPPIASGTVQPMEQAAEEKTVDQPVQDENIEPRTYGKPILGMPNSVVLPEWSTSALTETDTFYCNLAHETAKFDQKIRTIDVDCENLTLSSSFNLDGNFFEPNANVYSTVAAEAFMEEICDETRQFDSDLREEVEFVENIRMADADEFYRKLSDATDKFDRELREPELRHFDGPEFVRHQQKLAALLRLNQNQPRAKGSQSETIEQAEPSTGFSASECSTREDDAISSANHKSEPPTIMDVLTTGQQSGGRDLPREGQQFHCQSCNVTSQSFENFQQHLDGRRHQSKQKMDLSEGLRLDTAAKSLRDEEEPLLTGIVVDCYSRERALLHACLIWPFGCESEPLFRGQPLELVTPSNIHLAQWVQFRRSAISWDRRELDARGVTLLLEEQCPSQPAVAIPFLGRVVIGTQIGVERSKVGKSRISSANPQIECVGDPLGTIESITEKRREFRATLEFNWGPGPRWQIVHLQNGL